jgi:hypothetical protein
VVLKPIKNHYQKRRVMDDQPPNSYCPEVNRRLSELHFLAWLAQQKKEKRRLVIATLEALVGSSSAAKRSDPEMS